MIGSTNSFYSHIICREHWQANHYYWIILILFSKPNSKLLLKQLHFHRKKWKFQSRDTFFRCFNTDIVYPKFDKMVADVARSFQSRIYRNFRMTKVLCWEIVSFNISRWNISKNFKGISLFPRETRAFLKVEKVISLILKVAQVYL